MTQDQTWSREIALEPRHSGILFVDVQNYCAGPDGGEFKGIPADEMEAKYGYYFDRMKNLAVPNMQRLQKAFRAGGMELLYTTVECLTLDCRDRSLDYKVSQFEVPKGSWDGKVIDEIAPDDNEIWLPKGSSSVFVSTHIDYLLRCLEVRQLVICGVVTDQCVESAVRDACDLGYLVTLVPDACATYSQERHDNTLRAIKGYCRQRTTDELLVEIGEAKAA
jgi:nicotinamidase-related amidase